MSRYIATRAIRGANALVTEAELMLNKALIEEGLAKVVIYEKRKKLKYQDELIQAEEGAKEKNLGIWR